MKYSSNIWKRRNKLLAQIKREEELEKFYKNKQLLEKLVPIQWSLLQKLEKLYNMYWKNNNLHCPKFNNAVVAVKTKSLLDKSDVYSVSKVFITTEYERTHLPILREFMQQIKTFSNDLKIFDKNEQERLETLMKRYRLNSNFNIGDVVDEEINYI